MLDNSRENPMLDPMEKICCVHLIISGRVQGVGYRAFTKSRATKLNVNGWVRNLTNGNVEAVISGPEQIVDEMLEDLRRGPIASHVSDIQISKYEENLEPGFKHLPTV